MEFRYISLHVKVLCVSGRVFILFCPYVSLRGYILVQVNLNRVSLHFVTCDGFVC